MYLQQIQALPKMNYLAVWLTCKFQSFLYWKSFADPNSIRSSKAITCTCAVGARILLFALVQTAYNVKAPQNPTAFHKIHTKFTPVVSTISSTSKALCSIVVMSFLRPIQPTFFSLGSCHCYWAGIHTTKSCF